MQRRHNLLYLSLCALFFGVLNLFIGHWILILPDPWLKPVDVPRSDGVLAIDTRTRGKVVNWNTDHNIPTDGFSACLLLKDDTSKLAEWLAYHWLVLPLKYLVVAVDPTGTSSPREILELWNRSEMGMEIVFWNDIDYGHWIDTGLDEKHQHRSRQKHLISDCLKFHKDQNRTWVVIIDVDEYITYNIISDDEGSIASFLDYEGIPKVYTNDQYINATLNIRRSLPDLLKNGVQIYDYLTKHLPEDPWASEPCYLMSRLFFSSVEEPLQDLARADVARYGFDATRFSTLRYFHHAEKGVFEFNRYGKVMIDLSRINQLEIKRNMFSIHRPLECTCMEPLRPYQTSIFRVHHYLGSWEQYSSRPDVRRSKEVFNKSAFVDHGVNYVLQDWLKKFVEKVGESKSRRLLASAGKIFSNGNTKPLLERNDYKFAHSPSPSEKEEKLDCVVYYYYDMER